MNDQQEKLYQAMLDLNEQAKAAGEPYIKDTTQANNLLTRLASLTGTKTAADICARISDGRFEEELAAEIRTLTAARQDFADSTTVESYPTTGRMEYLYMCLYMESHAENADFSKEMWRAIRISEWLATGSAPVIIGQHPATNLLSEFLRSDRQLRLAYVDKSRLAVVDDEFKFKNYSIRLLRPDKNEVSVTTLMLYDFLFWCYVDTGQLITVVPLEKYAELRGKPLDTRNHITAFKAQVNKDLDALAAFGFKRIGKNKKTDQLYIGFGGETRGIYKDEHDRKGPGNITWRWNPDFIESMSKNSKTMAFFPDFFKLDPRTNAYCFARYIALNVRRNEEKHPVFKITIQKLLEEARFLPDYETLKRNRISVKDRLMAPTFRDLDAIPHIVYDAYTPDGCAIKSLDQLSDSDFMGGYIMVDCSAFPIKKERILQKNGHREKLQTATRNAIAANTAKHAASEEKAGGKKKKNAM